MDAAIRGRMGTVVQIRGWHTAALALAATAATLLAAEMLSPFTGGAPPMTLPLLAVVASGYLGGLWLGLASTAVIAAVTAFHFVGANHAAGGLDRWLAGLGVGIVVSVTSEALHARARRQELARRCAEDALHAELRAREARADEAVRASEALFTRIFHSSPVPKCITHLTSGRYVEINDAYVRLCGYTRAEMIGRTSTELGILRPGVRAALVADLCAMGPQRTRDIELHARTGEVRHLLTNAERIMLDGEPHMLILCVDVTDRLAAERALRERDERFSQLADSIREVFYLFDVERRAVLYCSPAYETIWGRPTAALYADARDWVDAIHPEDRERVRGSYEARSAVPVHDGYRIVRPDGAVRWIDDHVFPIVDAEGRVVRIAGVAADVTEARHLEEQVRQTQKMESIGLLAGGVAHDFNNVLTIILACAELLRPSVRDADREVIDDILTAVGRATSLTRQLLVFSRREVTEPRVLDLNAAILDIEKMLRRLIGEDVVLETALAPALGRVRIDPNQLLQTLMNLVVNARDAMPRGGRLTIASRDVDVAESIATLLGTVPPGRYAMVSITDTGCGMTAETQARVFEPFFTTKSAGRGTGMGLAVAHGIVRQAGGLIDVQSEVGVGTTFAIYLPCVDADASDRSGELAAGSLRGDEAVLLVEDADDVRRVTAHALEARGFRVLQASRGGDGLALLARHPEIRLLITDVVMPVMDGRELALEAARVAPGLKILYTSGYTDDAVVRHGVAAAEVAFLQKPFTPDLLVRKVREVLDRVA